MITSVMLARQITVPRNSPTKLTPLLRYSCKLFGATENVNSFSIKQIRTLSAKHPGWGVLPKLRSLFTRGTHRFFSPLFSWFYELLFSQLLYFHKHLRCPIVFPKSASHSQIRNSLCALCVPRWPKLPTASRGSALSTASLATRLSRSARGHSSLATQFSARMLVSL